MHIHSWLYWLPVLTALGGTSVLQSATSSNRGDRFTKRQIKEDIYFFLLFANFCKGIKYFKWCLFSETSKGMAIGRHWLRVRLNPEIIYCFQQIWKENNPFSPLALWRGGKQNIPSDMTQNFPDTKPVSPLESSKSLGFSQSIHRAQSHLLWKRQEQSGLTARLTVQEIWSWSFLCLSLFGIGQVTFFSGLGFQIC